MDAQRRYRVTLTVEVYAGSSEEAAREVESVWEYGTENWDAGFGEHVEVRAATEPEPMTEEELEHARAVAAAESARKWRLGAFYAAYDPLPPAPPLPTLSVHLASGVEYRGRLARVDRDFVQLAHPRGPISVRRAEIVDVRPWASVCSHGVDHAVELGCADCEREVRAFIGGLHHRVVLR